MEDVNKEQDRLTCGACPFGKRCDEILPYPAGFADLGEEAEIVVTICPRRYLQKNPPPLDDPFRWFDRYRRGLLPEKGGCLDQPSAYLECMTVLEHLFAETSRRIRRDLEAREVTSI